MYEHWIAKQESSLDSIPRTNRNGARESLMAKPPRLYVFRLLIALRRSYRRAQNDPTAVGTESRPKRQRTSWLAMAAFRRHPDHPSILDQMVAQ